ncbi:unnamed protein product [Paramecium primaurelia]|uniref:Myb-like domain-containing protein n=1 Tax=Paramecium primaurelia TaxID=5886 RepID=A0A8S1MNC7_PARPR|nr:unnamed protein product [Paramecium primaurelia]
MIHPLFSFPIDYQPTYQFENDNMPKNQMIEYAMHQNINDFPLYHQLQYPQQLVNYDIVVDQKTQNKTKKSKKHKKDDKKELLPKTKTLQEEPQKEEFLKTIVQPQYPLVHFTQSTLLPKLQSDIVTDGSPLGSKQTVKSSKHHQIKKPKKEHINTGHWSAIEHTTYVNFLSQYENIMNSSMMKKTSKIFKQMSELIGTRTPSQCRSHHQKFNPYAHRGENGKRLPRNERSRAGRKKKNQLTDIAKDEQIVEQDPFYMMFDKQFYFNPYMVNGIEYQQFLNDVNLKREDMPEYIHHAQPQDYEDYLKIRPDYNNQLDY